MKPVRSIPPLLASLLFFIATALSSWAGLSDLDNDPKNGAQTATWGKNSVITIYIPADMPAGDRANFEAGITCVVNKLAPLTVVFKTGEPPPDANDFVDVNIITPPGKVPPYANSGPVVPDVFPANNHFTTHSGVMDIDPQALGHSDGFGNFMKNLGAHEFGHVLGLDDTKRTSGDRVLMMDPDFELTLNNAGSQVIKTGEFICITDGERDLLIDSFAVPEGGPGLVSCIAMMLGLVLLRGIWPKRPA